MVEIALRGTTKTGRGADLSDALDSLAVSLGYRSVDCTPMMRDPSSNGRLATATLTAPIPSADGQRTDGLILGIIIIDRDA